MRKILIKNGLLWEQGKFRDLPWVDHFAEKNGFIYVERLVSAYPDNTILKIDEQEKIVESSKPMIEAKP